jgi:hypothetical protein
MVRSSFYLRDRLRRRVRIKTSEGYRETTLLKATTVHQEFRVPRRMLNVAVRKKFLLCNPCAGVEFPVVVKGLFRAHYATWSEQLTSSLMVRTTLPTSSGSLPRLV